MTTATQTPEHTDVIHERASIQIELGRLSLSDRNVRKTATGKTDDKELQASIASQGVLQNLVVAPEGKNKFGVIAGGRRLKALHALLAQKAVDKRYLVPCVIVEDESEITAVSLAENITQLPMHPADQYEAFHQLAEQGKAVGDIAALYGVGKQTVAKRLKLGQLAPAILDAYRADKIRHDEVIAYTVCEDHEKQLACFKHCGQRAWAGEIRRWLLGEAVSTDTGIGRFVGAAAYKKAGGAVSQDLFDSKTYLTDTALVRQLAEDKLTKEAAELQADEPGWLWVKSSLDGRQDTGHVVELAQTYIGVPDELNESLAAAQQEFESLDEWNMGNDDTLPEGYADEDAIYDRIGEIEHELDELEEQRDTYLGHTDEQRAYSGCFVTLGHSGEVRIQRGIAHVSDIPKSTADVDSPADGEAVKPVEQDAELSFSKSLEAYLKQRRQHAGKATLLQNPKLALDLLLFFQCIQLIDGAGWRAARYATSIGAHAVASETASGDTKSDKAAEEVDAYRSSLNLSWAKHEDDGAAFAAFMSLSKREKDKLGTFCAMASLQVDVRGRGSLVDAVLDGIEVDHRSYWTPTKDNYFCRRTRKQLLAEFGPVFGDEWLVQHDKLKKDDLITLLHGQFNADENQQDERTASWIPDAF
ncbi:MAG: ParB/RepB/Spo0J family partition protein [Pseudomonadota bacterium]